MPPVIRRQSLGGILRDLRKQSGLSQRELARRAGMHQTTIYDYERERHKPSQANLDRLLTALGASTTLRSVVFHHAGYSAAFLQAVQGAIPASVYIVSTAHKPLMAFTDEKQATAYRDGLGAQATRFVHVDSVQLKG